MQADIPTVFFSTLGGVTQVGAKPLPTILTQPAQRFSQALLDTCKDVTQLPHTSSVHAASSSLLVSYMRMPATAATMPASISVPVKHVPRSGDGLIGSGAERLRLIAVMNVDLKKLLLLREGSSTALAHTTLEMNHTASTTAARDSNALTPTASKVPTCPADMQIGLSDLILEMRAMRNVPACQTRRGKYHARKAAPAAAVPISCTISTGTAVPVAPSLEDA